MNMSAFSLVLMTLSRDDLPPPLIVKTFGVFTFFAASACALASCKIFSFKIKELIRCVSEVKKKRGVFEEC